MNKHQNVTEPTRSQYKGSPILTLPTGNGYGFSFGLRKAQSIIDHLEAIKSFIADQDQPTGEDSHLDDPPPADITTPPERD